MGRAGWVLVEGSDGWSVGTCQGADVALTPVARPASETPVDMAAALAAVLRAQGYRGEPVLLALASQRCLPGSITLPERRAARETLRFALEEQLPLAAEEFAADFVVGEGTALGVAVEVAGLRELLAALEERGVRVDSLTPAALLAAQASADNWTGIVLWGAGEACEWLAFRQGRLTGWQTLGSTEQVLARVELERRAAGDQLLLLRAFHLPEELAARLRSLEGLDATFAERDLTTAAVEHGCQALAGKLTLSIDLRRDGLAPAAPLRQVRGPLDFAFAAAGLLAAAIVLGLFARAWQYETLASELTREQEVVFAKLFPNRAIPAGIRTRLESERTRAAALAGEQGQLPTGPHGLAVFRSLLVAIPSELQLRVTDLRLERGRLLLEGEVGAHADADTIAASLRKQGFTVDPPRTQALAGRGVSFRLTGEVQPAGKPSETPATAARPRGEARP